MKTFLEEDKEVRYFPTDSEIPILIHYLQVYFSHPERSIQRSQVVQSVVSILSPKNNHWNHRTVRLWFNNNKKVFYRPSSPIQQNSKDIQPQSKQPLYIPARPLSVVQIPPTVKTVTIQPQPPIKMPQMNMKINIPPPHQQYQSHINQAYQCSPFLLQQQPQPPPSPVQHSLIAKPGSFALTLNGEIESIRISMMNNPQNIQQMKESIEKNITEKISSLHEQRWMQLATVQPCKTSIIDSGSIDAQSNTLNEKFHSCLQNVAAFDMIDCATVTPNGEVAVISWDCADKCQNFYFRDHKKSLSGLAESQFPFAKTIAYSEKHDTFWINTGNYLRSFLASDLSEGPRIKTQLKYSELSAMTFWNEKLVLASGSSIMSWSSKNLEDLLRDHDKETENREEKESIELNERKNDSSSNFDLRLTLMIPSITSLTTVDESLVIASSEHHTAQVYATNGALAAKCIGHTSGITCLHSFDSNSFITGSADQTAKYWDIRVQVPVFNLLRHRGIVTDVYGCGAINPNLIITGGTDGVIRGWDIRQLKHLFTFPVGPGSPLATGIKPENDAFAVVTSERITESFYDLEKYGPRFSTSSKLLDVSPNAVLTYPLPI